MSKQIYVLDKSYVKIFHLDDENNRDIGNIISNPKSRKILALTAKKEMHAREIGKKLENRENPHLPGIKFHLNKMVECGLVSYKIKLQRKKGKYLKYYSPTCTYILISLKQNVKS